MEFIRKKLKKVLFWKLKSNETIKNILGNIENNIKYLKNFRK